MYKAWSRVYVCLYACYGCVVHAGARKRSTSAGYTRRSLRGYWVGAAGRPAGLPPPPRSDHTLVRSLSLPFVSVALKPPVSFALSLSAVRERIPYPREASPSRHHSPPPPPSGASMTPTTITGGAALHPDPMDPRPKHLSLSLSSLSRRYLSLYTLCALGLSRMSSAASSSRALYIRTVVDTLVVHARTLI